MPSVTPRHRLLAAAIAVLTTAAAVLAVSVLSHREDPQLALGFILVSIVAGLAFGVVGLVLMSEQPRNPLGPLLGVAGVALLLEFVGREIAHPSLTPGGAGPVGARTLVWLGLVVDPLFFPVPIALALLLFPDGHLPSRRWSPVVILAVVATVGRVAVIAVTPGPLSVDSYGWKVPWGGLAAESARDALRTVDALLLAGSLILLCAAAIAVALRYRGSHGEARQRLKPLALAGLVLVVSLLLQAVPGVHGLAVIMLVTSVAVLVPLALVVGALHYRVWDIDPFLVGTLVYGGLALLVATSYALAVSGAAAVAGAPQPDDLGPALVAVFLVALLLGPLRRLVEHGARRLVYGARATPYELLARLPRRLADTPAPDDVLPRVADALVTGLGVPRARVSAAAGGGRLEAWAPAPPHGAEPDLVVVPVRHLGQHVGDIAVQAPGERLLGEADRRLLHDLAAQAGPLLRSVALSTELERRLEQITEQSGLLTASRERLAAAQVEERRRLERDIHDGAQQQLVGLAVRLQGAESAAGHGDVEGAAEQLRAARADLDRCIDDLRELARGIYPPVLTARGLGPALRARARAGGNDVRVVVAACVDGQRLPAAIETAVYFSALEALQNTAKHAPDALVDVTLDAEDGVLTFTVSDDGPGFDPDAVDAASSGLVGMADRLGAVGGTLAVESHLGEGTTVAGRVPL
jgi:signal transduction histidine kinase